MLLIVIAMALVAAPAGNAQSGVSSAQTPAPSGMPSSAPLNPRFVEYLQERAQGLIRPMTTADGHGLGLIPSPMDLSHLQGQPTPLSAGTPPASYDLRTMGKVTPVKNQGSCGACWTFATYGSLESSFLPSETWDFSENNLKDLSGFDSSPCSGGTGLMSMAYLARWGNSTFQAGPVIETDDLYQPTDTNSSPAFPPGVPVRKHIQDAILLAKRQSATDNNALKNAVMQYGGVWTSMLWSDAAYNPATHSYYYDGSNGSTNQGGHAVTLAGWDDNYSATKFLKPPAGNGAFLIKNSWGTSWGDGGYFWISYYDIQYAIRNESWVFWTGQPVTNYSRQYEYDPLGWVGGWSYSSTTGWFANTFTAAANEELKAVSTYVASNSSPYWIYVFTAGTTTPIAQTSGTFPSAGYHTVLLPTPVALTQGQQFTVEVGLTTPGYIWPIPIHYASTTRKTTRAPAMSPGRSFVSRDGQTWIDTTTLNPADGIPGTMSVALKAFTGPPQTRGDFDGDGKADVAVFRPANGTWFVIPSNTPSNFMVKQWGAPGDIPVLGDYDGDGKTDVAVFRPSSGTWFVIPESNPTVPIVQQWGANGDIPVPGDYDRDGKTDFAVFRPSSGTWFIVPSSNPTNVMVQQWGTQGDIPVPGDYDGDGKTDLAVFRPSSGTWFIIPSSNPNTPIVQQWGTSGDIPVPGDYDGDGKSDFAVWRPSSGTWFVIPSNSPNAPIIQQWGVSTDVPVPFDYDGDRKTDFAVWRPSNGTWYVIPSLSPTNYAVTQWGTQGDVPVQKPVGQ